MVQDHRNNQDFSLAAGSRATGAPATQRRAGPGPCGPVPDLPRPHTEGYIIVNGRRENISNPQYVARTLLALAAPSSHNTNTGPRHQDQGRGADGNIAMA